MRQNGHGSPEARGSPATSMGAQDSASDNTTQLDVRQVKDLLLNIDFIQRQLQR